MVLNPDRKISSMSASPLVSVIIPIFNAEETLPVTLNSVLNQSRKDWEAFLIDDGSVDKSIEISKSFVNYDSRFKWVCTEGRHGAGAARNIGISTARGRYIAFLDADDTWHPEKLARQLDFMEANNAALSCTAYLRNNVSTGQKDIIGVPDVANRREILKVNTIGCSTVIYDTFQFGLRQMPLLRRRQDFVFWLNLLEDVEYVYGLPIALTTYHTGRESLSSNKFKAALNTWYAYYKLPDLTLKNAVWYFTNYSIHGILRYFFPKLALKMGWIYTASLPD